MVNKARQIGTKYENKVLERLLPFYPDAHRAESGNESWDIRGVDDLIIECKCRSRWDIQGWVRKIRKVAEHRPWVIYVSDRDLRRSDSPGEVVVMDPEFFNELLHAWKHRYDI